MNVKSINSIKIRNIIFCLFSYTSLVHVINAEPISENKVLAGLVIRHGEIIDALQPIYQKIKSDGALSEIEKGPSFGGSGGGKTTVFKNGYVLVGLTYDRGYWMGSKRIAGLKPIFQKWENGKVVGDRIMVNEYGLRNKVSSKKSINKIPENGNYITEMVISDSDLSELGYKKDGMYISDIQLKFNKPESKLREATSAERDLFESKETETLSESTLQDLPFNEDYQYYSFKVNIISGSKRGQIAEGIISFPKSAEGKSQVANSFYFNYDDHHYSIVNAGVPKAHLIDGELSRLAIVSGPKHHRFGFNGGFSRMQFGRSSESFIRKGEEYFGYLNPRTYVDGAGKISYEKLNSEQAEAYLTKILKSKS